MARKQQIQLLRRRRLGFCHLFERKQKWARWTAFIVKMDSYPTGLLVGAIPGLLQLNLQVSSHELLSVFWLFKIVIQCRMTEQGIEWLYCVPGVVK